MKKPSERLKSDSLMPVPPVLEFYPYYWRTGRIHAQRGGNAQRIDSARFGVASIKHRKELTDDMNRIYHAACTSWGRRQQSMATKTRQRYCIHIVGERSCGTSVIIYSALTQFSVVCFGRSRDTGAARPDENNVIGLVRLELATKASHYLWRVES